jgi:glycosyl transferase family 2
MKLVMTLLARDEADIVESWLAFHLNAGADFVIATDNRSEDGTTDVLERYAREGHVHLIREPGEDLRQDEWVTRMARLAATEFAADWVINSDADEFWWPRGETLSEMLAAVPERYGTVSGFLRTFVPRGGEGDFAERMTVRFSALAPINDPASLYKPIRKVLHRAHPEIRLTRGNHAVVDSPFAPLRGWFPIEVFHFPIRSFEQFEHKTELQRTAFEQYVDRPPTGYHARMFDAMREGRMAEHYDSLLVSDAELEAGRADGRLVDDTRLRDALRLLRAPDGGFLFPADAPALAFPTPTLVEDADYAVEAAVLGEADVVRLQRRLDTLERRLASIELRLPNRVYRKASAAAKRVLGRDGRAG